ncbi:NADH-quinone oxidoreductase subunit C, partial [Moraxella catarrhalis]|nr:NADH-quinone oxidoreductase subunit C [Moraxella catarrhalis]
ANWSEREAYDLLGIVFAHLHRGIVFLPSH